MIYIVVGLLFQLFAGLIFALPHVSPGITERIEKSWRTGRGKLRSVVIIWSVICFILIILLWVSNYAEAIHNVDIFLNALVGSIASLAGYSACYEGDFSKVVIPPCNSLHNLWVNYRWFMGYSSSS